MDAAHAHAILKKIREAGFEVERQAIGGGHDFGCY